MANKEKEYYLPWRGILTPKKNTLKFQKLGFQLSEFRGPEVLSAQLPDGWTISPPASHTTAIENNTPIAKIYDEKNRQRVFLQYLFYQLENKLHTYSYLLTRYTIEIRSYPLDNSNTPAYHIYTAVDREKLFPEIMEFGRVANSELWWRGEQVAAVARTWMNRHYPFWDDPLAYWT